jgi:hypothetical protein
MQIEVGSGGIMTESVQGVWNRFERWANRYTKSCAVEIARICRKGYSDGPTLFLLKSHEVRGDPVLDFGLGKAELNERIQRRIAFFCGYLVDISFDGGEFMSKHSQFLTLQYPQRSEKSLGVWLEQSMEGKIEGGAYHGFQDFDISFFIRDIGDIDVASMREVLPFKWMHLRKPGGEKWNHQERRELEQKLEYDLCFDGHDHKLQMRESGEMLTLTFKWL